MNHVTYAERLRHHEGAVNIISEELERIGAAAGKTNPKKRGAAVHFQLAPEHAHQSFAEHLQEQLREYGLRAANSPFANAQVVIRHDAKTNKPIGFDIVLSGITTRTHSRELSSTARVMLGPRGKLPEGFDRPSDLVGHHAGAFAAIRQFIGKADIAESLRIRRAGHSVLFITVPGRDVTGALEKIEKALRAHGTGNVHSPYREATVGPWRMTPGRGLVGIRVTLGGTHALAHAKALQEVTMRPG